MNLSIADPAAYHHSKIAVAGPIGKTTEASHDVFQNNSEIDFERRFLTILFADVVNYCRMIEVDVLRTVSHLERLRMDVIGPIAEDYGADIVRNIGGDGLVISFADPLLAVRCAVGLQARVQSNECYWSIDEQLRFRMGIAMGSVLLANGDLHGNAMNVAARLQALAEPGEIWVTEPVTRQAHMQADITFQPLGQLHLRNIEEGVEAYRVTCRCDA